ncbi:MAG: hypothetical protein KF788_18025 [Piscinibacter sp.]|nr:hypothetical protein [Piscinibacter sp.]
MKTQISRDSFRPAANYAGVYLQQGRMIVDADWNEATAIANARLEAALRDAVASGAPRLGGLAIVPAGSGVAIRPGALYVEGVPARLAGTADITLLGQPDYAHAPALPGGGNFRLYADVWERCITGIEDDGLLDAGLHGADTATRTRTLLQVKWCADGIDPADPAQNPPLGNAALALQLRQIAVDASDPCNPCAAELEVDEPVGNYLFRVEVHDVFTGTDGHPHLWLKWSRDNGAEAYTPETFPAGFDQGDWVWEYFDSDSENLLGHHFPAGQARRRGVLVESFDASRPAGTPGRFVRQWDGFAEIDLSSHTLLQGADRGVTLSAGLGADAHGAFRFGARPNAVSLNLELFRLELVIVGTTFVAGDYWQVPVRQATDASGDWLLGSASTGEPPRGPRHHYLPLARVSGGVLTPPADVAQADAESRRFHFPPLTDLRAADIGFTPTCAGLYGSAPNVQAALDALCSIGAEDIAYTPATCAAVPSVRSLLGTVPGYPDVDGDGRATVKDQLDALLCHLNAARLPYDGSTSLARWRDVLENPAGAAPTTAQQAIDVLLNQFDSSDLRHTLNGCVGNADMPRTVSELLALGTGEQPLSTLLNRLFCELNATHLPLRKGTLACADLRTDASVLTVQDALDKLCESAGDGCEVSVAPGQLESRLREFQASTLRDLSLCLLPGAHNIAAALQIGGKRALRIRGVAPNACVIVVDNLLVELGAEEIVLEGLFVRASRAAQLQLNSARASVSRCNLQRSGSVEGERPFVRVGTRTQMCQLAWRDNFMIDTWTRTTPIGNVLTDAATLGNVTLAEQFRGILDDPSLFNDPERFDRQVGGVLDTLESLPVEQRVAVADAIQRSVLGGASAPVKRVAAKTAVKGAVKGAAKAAPKAAAKTTRAVASKKAAAAATAPGQAIGRATVSIDRLGGNLLQKDGTSNVVLRDELLRAAVQRDALQEAIVGGLLAVVTETGNNIALAISSNDSEVTLADNRVFGEVLLMNQLERAGTGVPAAQVGVDPELATLNRVDGDVGFIVGGRFVCRGNRILRLRCLVPQAQVTSGRLAGNVRCFAQAVLDGNQLVGYGHSLAARALQVNGNDFDNGNPGRPRPTSRFFCARTTFAGNSASFADEFTPTFISAEPNGVAATLFLVRRFPS